MQGASQDRPRAPDQLAREVQEGLLVVVVALRADLVVLQVLLPARICRAQQRFSRGCRLPWTQTPGPSGPDGASAQAAAFQPSSFWPSGQSHPVMPDEGPAPLLTPFLDTDLVPGLDAGCGMLPEATAALAACMTGQGCREGWRILLSDSVWAAAAPVERDLLGLDLAVLHVHFVAAQHNGDAFAHPARNTPKAALKSRHATEGRACPDS